MWHYYFDSNAYSLDEDNHNFTALPVHLICDLTGQVKGHCINAEAFFFAGSPHLGILGTPKALIADPVF
jgi:hypothetical protein